MSEDCVDMRGSADDKVSKRKCGELEKLLRPYY
jgi:hypothetical protein